MSTMPSRLRTISLKCVNYGAELGITPEVDPLACARCGAKVNLSSMDKEREGANGVRDAVIVQAQAERKKATIIAVVVFILFVIAGFISAMPSKVVWQKSEMIFTVALIVLVGIGVAISVKVSLNKKATVKLGEQINSNDQR